MKLLSLLRPGTLCLGSLMAFSSTGFLSPALLAQSQNNTSVAEAARKAKEQKKGNPKESRVITEETLTLRPASWDTGEAPPAGTVINTTPVMPTAETTSAPSDAAATAPAETAPASPAEPAKPTEPSAPAKPTESSAPQTDSASAQDDAKKAEEQAAEIAKAKEVLAQAKSELDLAKRELALQNDTFFSNPDYAHDSAGKAKLDDLQRMIEEKQTSVQDLKQRLEQLMLEAGISPDSEQTPAPSAQ